MGFVFHQNTKWWISLSEDSSGNEQYRSELKLSSDASMGVKKTLYPSQRHRCHRHACMAVNYKPKQSCLQLYGER